MSHNRAIAVQRDFPSGRSYSDLSFVSSPATDYCLRRLKLSLNIQFASPVTHVSCTVTEQIEREDLHRYFRALFNCHLLAFVDPTCPVQISYQVLANANEQLITEPPLAMSPAVAM